MMSAAEFLAVIEEKDLVSKELLFTLYKRVAQSQQPVSAAEIAKILIDQGYLTPALAHRLMGPPPEQHLQSAAAPEKEEHKPREKLIEQQERTEQEEKKEVVEDIGFAPLKEEREPRPVIGRHRPYKLGDSGKNLGTPPTEQKSPIPAKPAQPPKHPPMDKPASTRWATSMYDREIDTSKGIVSPRLVKLAGVEQIPRTVLLPRRNKWMWLLVRAGIGLGLVVIIYVLIHLFLRYW